MFACGSAMLTASFNKESVQELLDRRNLLWMGVSWILISLGYGYIILFVM